MWRFIDPVLLLLAKRLSAVVSKARRHFIKLCEIGFWIGHVRMSAKFVANFMLKGARKDSFSQSTTTSQSALGAPRFLCRNAHGKVFFISDGLAQNTIRLLVIARSVTF